MQVVAVKGCIGNDVTVLDDDVVCAVTTSQMMTLEYGDKAMRKQFVVSPRFTNRCHYHPHRPFPPGCH